MALPSTKVRYVDWHLTALNGLEGDALERLGDHTFDAWADRGWWAAHTERSNA